VKEPEPSGAGGAAEEVDAPRQPKRQNLAFRIATWLLAALCFYVIFTRIDGAAARDGLTIVAYLGRFFGEAGWGYWLAIMIPYSLFYFFIDAHVTWRVVRWFVVPEIRLGNLLPIRGSAYILSLINEQVGKGAMSLYLYRRYRVSALAAISCMLMLGLMEIYQLLLFASIGIFTQFEMVRAASTELPLDRIFQAVIAAAVVYLPLHIAFFRGYLLKGLALRDRNVFRAFRQARPQHYLLVVLFKAPALIGAVVVYTLSLELFNVDVNFGKMLAFLPVIFLAAALPLPFRAGALLLWTVLFPDFPEVAVFSLVMHSFFLLFNASIGLLFLPRANRELFGEDRSGDGAVRHG